jgi:uncharacterized membrane protein
MTKVERILGNLLSAGVVVAGVMVLVGAFVYLAAHGVDRPDYSKFHAQPSKPSLDGRGIIQLGILVLIATPIARVAFSVGAFARAGDRRYAAIGAIVLAVLAYSLFGNH